MSDADVSSVRSNPAAPDFHKLRQTSPGFLAAQQSGFLAEMQSLTKPDDGFDAGLDAVRDEVGVARFDERLLEIILALLREILDGLIATGHTDVARTVNFFCRIDACLQDRKASDRLEDRAWRIFFLHGAIDLRLEFLIAQNSPLLRGDARDKEV